jgi:hypothetical protein
MNGQAAGADRQDYSNLLSPLSGSERTVTQVDAPARTIRDVTRAARAYGPMRSRTRFLRGY